MTTPPITRRMGVVDKLAVGLVKSIDRLIHNDEWLDLLEDATVDTSAKPFELETPQGEAVYLRALDDMERRVLARAAQAILNTTQGTYDKVAHAANLVVDAGK